MQEEEQQSPDCPICMDKLINDLHVLECNHLLHRECINGHFTNAIDSRTFPILCPNIECRQEIQQSDFQSILNEEYSKKLQDYVFQQFVDSNAQDMSWCPTAGCSYVFIFDENATSILNCNVCCKKYCLACKVIFHEGRTCKEYRMENEWKDNDEQAFQNYVKGQKFKQCSKCKFWVEKNAGCNHMTCRCQYQFCYVCGGKWMQCECVQKMPNMDQIMSMPILAPQRRNQSKSKNKKKKNKK